MNNRCRFVFVFGVITLGGCAGNPAGTKIYNPVSYGATGDGQTLSTAAIQKAIDECFANGGGLVQLPEGRFISGTIFMKSGVTLELSENSTLVGSTNLDHYPVTIPEFRSYTDNYTVRSLIYGENLSNITITGKGTIDGQGKLFPGEWHVRPYGMRFITCRNVRVENITLRNSPMWMQHYLACDNVTISRINVWNHSNINNDGIDIDGCHNVLIDGCTVDSEDDAICLKSTSARMCENVTIKNCTISSYCNAVKCGTETNGGFKNIVVRNCSIQPSQSKAGNYGSPYGLAGIALLIVDGGAMDGVSISDIDIEGTMAPIFIKIGNRARIFKAGLPRPAVGTIRNVTISDINATGAGELGCAIAGLKGHPIENLTLRNLNMSFPGGGKKQDSIRQFDEKAEDYPECSMFMVERLPAYGFYFWHVDGIKIENVKLTPEKPDERFAYVLEDTSNILIDGKTVTSPRDLPEGFHLIDNQ